MLTAQILLFSKDGQLIFWFIFIIFYIFIFIFWIKMLIHAAKNKQGPGWIIIIALFGFIGALIYFFSVYKRIKNQPAVISPSTEYYIGGENKDDIVKY